MRQRVPDRVALSHRPRELLEVLSKKWFQRGIGRKWGDPETLGGLVGQVFVRGIWASGLEVGSAPLGRCGNVGLQAGGLRSSAGGREAEIQEGTRTLHGGMGPGRDEGGRGCGERLRLWPWARQSHIALDLAGRVLGALPLC